MRLQNLCSRGTRAVFKSSIGNEFCSPKFLVTRQHSNSCNETCSNPLHNHQRKAYSELNRSFWSSSTPPGDTSIKILLENNKKYVADKLKEDPAYFEKVGGPQHPTYLYFGCADSRVPANEILGLG